MGGLPLDAEAALPFLLTARAQGQLAQAGGTRAFFAEGLASSYEAFHHTRSNRQQAKDVDDGLQPEDNEALEDAVPTKWYESQIAKLIPSRKSEPELRLQHPKVAATPGNRSRDGKEGDRPVFSVNVFVAKMVRLAEKRPSPRPPRERLLRSGIWMKSGGGSRSPC